MRLLTYTPAAASLVTQATPIGKELAIIAARNLYKSKVITVALRTQVA